MVIDCDDAIAARGDPRNAPLGATSVDRSVPMLFDDHPIHLASV
jgi:hypothetical protein